MFAETGSGNDSSRECLTGQRILGPGTGRESGKIPAPLGDSWNVPEMRISFPQSLELHGGKEEFVVIR